jgi:hypothetical protein
MEKSAALYAWFQMKLIAKQDFRFLKGVAFHELEGTGTWLFMEERMLQKWYSRIVKTNKAWMNQFAFLLNPLFKISHDIIMKGSKRAGKKIECNTHMRLVFHRTANLALYIFFFN